MIFSSLSQSARYAALHPLFARAFDYIRDTDLFNKAPGRYHIAGDDLIAIVEHVPAKTKAAAKLEAHRKYIDIQLVLEGDETMGWKPIQDCLNPVSEHSDERDIRFFHDAPASYVPVPPDHFCIFFPEDAHAPLIAGNNQAGNLIRKVIFKVAAAPAPRSAE
jgi:biofilm protein TabA